MLPELHEDYQKHITKIRQSGLLNNKLKVLAVQQNENIATALHYYDAHISRLLSEPVENVNNEAVLFAIAVMAFSLDTLFRLESNDKNEHKESLLFLTVFFLQITLDLTKAHSQFRNNQQIMGIYNVLSSILENPAYAYDKKEYPQIAELHWSFINNFLQFNKNILRSKGINTVDKNHLEFHIARKNRKTINNAKPFNGQLIYHRESLIWRVADRQVVDVTLAPSLMKIFKGDQKRTQFFVYIEGQGQHVLTLDVQNNDQTLECICIESGSRSSQIDFMAYLQKFFVSKDMDFDILMTRAELQKDDYHCPVFSFALGSVVSQIDFSQLKKDSKQISDGVSTFKVSALGLKAILMAQSSEDMKKLLLEAKAPEALIKSWTTQYKLELGKDDKSFTYIHHRAAGLRKKEGTDMQAYAIRQYAKSVTMSH